VVGSYSKFINSLPKLNKITLTQKVWAVLREISHFTKKEGNEPNFTLASYVHSKKKFQNKKKTKEIASDLNGRNIV